MSMTPNAFEALSAGEKAHRAFAAVSQAANAQALRPGADDTGQALAYALHLLAGYVPATCWPAAPELPPEGADVFDQIAQRATPQAGAGMSPPPCEPHGPAQAVTVRHPVLMAGSRVFEVREGVPLAEAMDALSLLMATAQAVSHGLATTGENASENPGALWAPVHLLELAGDLQASIHLGLLQAKGGGL